MQRKVCPHQLADGSEVGAVWSHVTQLSKEEVALTNLVVHQGRARCSLTQPVYNLVEYLCKRTLCRGEVREGEGGVDGHGYAHFLHSRVHSNFP